GYFNRRGQLFVLDLTTGKESIRVELDSGYLPCAAFNSSRTTLIYCDGAGLVQIIDTRLFVSKTQKIEPLFVTDRGVDLDHVTADEKTWPQWWRGAKQRIPVPENAVPNPRFGLPICSLVVDTRCKGLQLTGTSGLPEETRNDFVARGAVYEPGVLERLRGLF